MSTFSLKILNGQSKGEEFSFSKECVTIGRNSNNSELVLNDQSVSAFHATIEWVDNNFYLEDNNSTNGTVINGQAIHPHVPIPLSDNDEVQFGRLNLLFHQNSTNRIFPGISSTGMSQTMSSIKKPLQKANMKPIIIGFILFIFGIALFVAFSKKNEGISSVKKANNSTHSMVHIPLPSKGPFGQSSAEKTSRSHTFSFVGNHEDAKLILTAMNIDKDEIQVLINGRKLNYLPITFSDIETLTIQIPQSYIIPNLENIISFTSVSGHNGWKIKDLKLTFIAEEVCDVKQGEKYYELGNEMYAEQAVNEPNLYLAVQNFAQAISYSLKCNPPPIYYLDVRDKHAHVENLLNEQIQEIFFLSEKLTRQQQYSEATALLETISLRIPDSKDTRVQKATLLLSKKRNSAKTSK